MVNNEISSGVTAADGVSCSNLPGEIGFEPFRVASILLIYIKSIEYLSN